MKKIIITVFFATIFFTANSQQMQCAWANQIGGSGWDVVTGLTILKDSQLVVVGTFYDKISFATDTLASNGSRDVFLASFRRDGSFIKAISFGGTGYDYAKKIEPTGESGMVASIQFNQSIQIGGQKLGSKYQNNLLLAGFDKNLNHTSHTLISGNGKFEITCLKRSTGGDISFSGWFTDTLVVGNQQYISRGEEDIFLGIVSPQCNLKWFEHYGGDGKDFASALVLDQDSIHYLAGLSTKGLNQGGKTTETIPDGMSHLFISRLSKTGKGKDLDFPLNGHAIEPVEILKDSSSVWVLANFRHSAFFREKEIKSNGQSDVLLFKYDTKDQSATYCRLGGAGNDVATGLVKSGEHLIVTGLFTDSLVFSGQKVNAHEHGTDVFIASATTDCLPGRIVSLGGEGREFPCSILADETGIYIAGEFTGKMKAGASELESNGEEDVFLLRIENCGTRKPLDIRVEQLSLGQTGQSWELDAGPGYTKYVWGDNSPSHRYYTAWQPGTYQVVATDLLGCDCIGAVTIAGTKSAKLSPDQHEERAFRLYPSVTSGVVYWEPASAWGDVKANVRVFDPSGKLVIHQKLNELAAPVYQIGFTGQPSGVYLIEVSGNGFRETARVIVKK